MRIRALIAALVITAGLSVVLFIQWTGQGGTGLLLSDLRPLELVSHGRPSPAGNLLAIEAQLAPADYQSPERLYLKFRTHLMQAQNEGLLHPNTLVLLPPHVGTGLFASGEKIEAQQARTLRDAMQWTALSNPLRYLDALIANRAEDRRTEAVLRMKAGAMSEAYQAVFGELAKEFKVTLVAGSIVLPSPSIEATRLQTGRGPLQQVAVVFDASGRVMKPLARQTAPGRYERRYLAVEEVSDRQLVTTPLGPVQISFGCPTQRASREDVAIEVLLVTQDRPKCKPTDGTQPAIQFSVSAWSLPWNLTGSPRKPAPDQAAGPGRLINLWLP